MVSQNTIKHCVENSTSSGRNEDLLKAKVALQSRFLTRELDSAQQELAAVIGVDHPQVFRFSSGHVGFWKKDIRLKNLAPL